MTGQNTQVLLNWITACAPTPVFVALVEKAGLGSAMAALLVEGRIETILHGYGQGREAPAVVLRDNVKEG